MAELCLGTVQFGTKYGINNKSGQPVLEDSFKMLDYAIDKGIDVIDTAAAYGNAEDVLGQYLVKRKNSNKVKVVSKLRPNVIETDNLNIEKSVRKELVQSLTRLHVDHLEGYLLHDAQYIYNNEVMQAMNNLKKEGLAVQIGASIYDIEDGYHAIDTGIVDYIQLPYNILDQRGSETGFFEAAVKKGITIFTRSVFLQGLIMMDKKQIPKHLWGVIPYINIFENLLEKYDIMKADALIHFVCDEPNIGYLVFGVDTIEQLAEFIERYRVQSVPKEFIMEVKKYFNHVNEYLISPNLWGKKKK